MKKINLGQKEIIHFVGIGGIGMSGLAQIMKNMGFKIQGSDQNRNKNTASCLKAGIKIFIGHSKKNIENSYKPENIDIAIQFLKDRVKLIPEDIHPYFLNQYSNPINSK